MPNYEYRCLDCGKRFEVFLSYSEYGKTEIQCTHCLSINVSRRIGRIRIAKNQAERLENMADPNNLAALEDDPVALGKMMRQMSGELGEEMPAEFDEVVGRLEKGQTPEQIEKDLPDLAEPDSPMLPGSTDE